MNEPSPSLLLRAPLPTQTRLSFCEPTPRDFKRWIAGLPKANIGETARQLYQGLAELNQLLTPSDNRLQLLELLRPEVYYVCKHLERHFLNQMIVLDERSRKIANLCQALQSHLAIGYKQIVIRIAPRFKKERETLLSTSIQRAMHCLNGSLIRSSQLYCPAPEGLWLELHQLYRVASQHGLQHVAVADELTSHTRNTRIEQTYVVALLLGSSRCNQLRQNHIARLAETLEPWSRWVTLQAAGEASSLFAINLSVDGPARYRTLWAPEQQEALLGINPLALVKAIQHHLDLPIEQRSQSTLPVPSGFSLETLLHLCAAWGQTAERTFQRSVGQGTLTLCIGMSALHFYLSGRRSFSEVLKNPIASRPAQFRPLPGEHRNPDDPWAKAFDVDRQGSGEKLLPYEEIQYPQTQADGGAALSDSNQHFATYALPIINHSPGGYCLAWPKEVPDELQAGELVGILDTSTQSWSIAVARWIRQVRNGGTQMGIELISPHGQPCGLQLIRANEPHSQYLRALLLPQISAIDLPATLLVPRLPFQQGQQAMINTNGEEHPASLNKRMNSTGSFNRFEYQSLEQPKIDSTASGGVRGAEEEFASLWKSL
ncbi:molecular chaperone [Pseudomonas fluorescens]|uniref:Molecular chaperone n=1 Tax=Pseudomonas fluorescens TaxID=294 RepID=A0A5E7BMC6_PSEFL|nr:molecular chaperone [Pseudomonas fluorescens]VVN86211.1 hypothetical protein PS723_01486 [Pseudomonas fluorescens]